MEIILSWKPIFKDPSNKKYNLGGDIQLPNKGVLVGNKYVYPKSNPSYYQF